MKKVLSIIGAVIVLAGAVAGLLIYLKKKGIIEFEYGSPDDGTLEFECHCGEESEQEEPAEQAEDTEKTEE